MSPIFAVAFDDSQAIATVYAVSSDRASALAKGSLDSIGLMRRVSGVPVGRGAIVLDLAADRRQVIAVVLRGKATEAWSLPIVTGRLGKARRIAVPRQPAAAIALGDGRFLCSDKFGYVGWIAPYRPPLQKDTGPVGNVRVALRLMGDRAHYAVRRESWGLMGDAIATVVQVGRLSAGGGREEAWGGPETPNAGRLEPLFLPASREVWTLSGDPAAAVWRIANGKLRPARRVEMPVNARSAVEIRPNLLALWDAYGRLSLAQLSSSACRRLGKPVDLPGEVCNDIAVRATRDGSVLVLSSEATGSLWTVPVLASKALGTPRRLLGPGPRRRIALSY